MFVKYQKFTIHTVIWFSPHIEHYYYLSITYVFKEIDHSMGCLTHYRLVCPTTSAVVIFLRH